MLRSCSYSRQLLAISISAQDPEKHYTFLSEVSFLCRKHRREKIESIEDEYKSEALNTQNNKYYDPDNHELNAYKFSVKSYLQNVFGSVLD